MIAFMEMSLPGEEQSSTEWQPRAQLRVHASLPHQAQSFPPRGSSAGLLFPLDASCSALAVLAHTCCPRSSSPCTQSCGSSPEPGTTVSLDRATMASDAEACNLPRL